MYCINCGTTCSIILIIIPIFAKTMSEVAEKLLQHWLGLYNAGVFVSPDKLKSLQDANLIHPNTPFKPKNEGWVKNRLRKDFSIKTPDEIAADKYVDVIEAFGDEEEFHSVTSDKMWSAGLRKYTGGIEINKSMWLPYKFSVLEPDEDFVALIDSIVDYGFSNRIQNKKYDLYKQQAREWLAENDSITNYATMSTKVEFVRREADRCRENTLYALNKHLYLKEQSEVGGKRKYDAYDCQAFIMWLLDCGFSALIGKMRQIGFSTTIGASFEMKARVNKNMFIKFIAENDRKTEEIFKDKIKHPLTEAPAWFRPTVYNESACLLTYLYKKKKGMATGANSTIQVEPPYRTAINGGSPDIVGADEIGQIDILSEIILEGRPTMFYVDPRTKKMRMRRQFIGWGTAGIVDKGGGDFEKEFKACVKMWKERKFNYGLVPVFIDAFSKPGVDKSFYEQEMEVYYSRALENPAKSEAIKTLFHQTYPICIDDMFLSSAKALIPIPVINSHIQRIRNIPHDARPVWGRFEPIYDETKPMPENSDVPFRIIGSHWIPMEDFSMGATAMMYIKPNSESKHRFYQGTDPVSSETGYSKFASSIYDAVNNKIACQINFRESNFKYCYQQALLMNLYYGKIPHLIEYNIGSNLIEYIDQHDYYDTVVLKSDLPKYLQSGGAKEGIRKTTGNAKLIVNKLIELLESFIDNIDVEDFFAQLKTYNEKVTKLGGTTYSSSNPIYYNDDVIDSITYAYICAQCFVSYLTPVEKVSDGQKDKPKKFRYQYDGQYNIVLNSGVNNKKRRH